MSFSVIRSITSKQVCEDGVHTCLVVNVYISKLPINCHSKEKKKRVYAEINKKYEVCDIQKWPNSVDNGGTPIDCNGLRVRPALHTSEKSLLT